jgi:hypothetical protein
MLGVVLGGALSSSNSAVVLSEATLGSIRSCSRLSLSGSCRVYN